MLFESAMHAARSNELALLNERGLKPLWQTEVQRYLVETLLGFDGSFCYLVKSGTNTPPGIKLITWSDALVPLDLADFSPFVSSGVTTSGVCSYRRGAPPSWTGHYRSTNGPDRDDRLARDLGATRFKGRSHHVSPRRCPSDRRLSRQGASPRSVSDRPWGPLPAANGDDLTAAVRAARYRPRPTRTTDLAHTGELRREPHHPAGPIPCPA